MSNSEIAQRMARTEDFLKRLDANGNGMIDPDEASDPQAKNMLDRIFSRMGKEQHYPMAISEIMQGYETYYRARGNTSGGGASGPGSSSSAAGGTSPPGTGSGSPATPPPGAASTNASTSKPEISGVSNSAGTNVTVPPPSGQAVGSQGPASPAIAAPGDAKPAPRKPGRFLTARERLPKGLPDWFLEKDVHGNGQITMAEFTDNWTPEKLAEFARYDLNHDGIITAAECLKVEKAKAGSK